FVELNNATGAESSVVITFEHEGGKKVGFIELNVSSESPRDRIRGRTRNIDESGAWTAVVRTKEGEELARHGVTRRSGAEPPRLTRAYRARQATRSSRRSAVRAWRQTPVRKNPLPWSSTSAFVRLSSESSASSPGLMP